MRIYKPGSGISVDGGNTGPTSGASNVAYESGIVTLLGQIEGTVTGKAILAGIQAAASKKLIICPPNASKKEDQCSAKARQESLEGASEKGKPALTGTDEAGTGKGSNVRLPYEPGKWGQNEACNLKFGGGPGSGKDEILLHELVHSMRFMNGIGDQTRWQVKEKGYTPYCSWEEITAILVANVYLSEKRAPLLRGFDHTQSAVLHEPEKFLSNNKETLARLLRQTGFRPCLMMIARAPGSWNPIRDYLAANSK